MRFLFTTAAVLVALTATLTKAHVMTVKKGGPRASRTSDKLWCPINGEWKDREARRSILVEKEKDEVSFEEGPKYLVTLTTPFLRYWGEGRSSQPHHLAVTVSNQVFPKSVFLISFTCFGRDSLLLQYIPVGKNVVRPEVYLLERGNVTAGGV